MDHAVLWLQQRRQRVGLGCAMAILISKRTVWVELVWIETLFFRLSVEAVDLIGVDSILLGHLGLDSLFILPCGWPLMHITRVLIVLPIHTSNSWSRQSTIKFHRNQALLALPTYRFHNRIWSHLLHWKVFFHKSLVFFLLHFF